MRSRRRTGLLAGLVALVTLTGCSQGAKQDAADRVRDSIPSDRGALIRGSYTLTIRPKEIGGARQVQLKGGLLSTAGFVAEPGARKTALVVAAVPGQPSAPVFLGAGRSLYARRASQSARERRPWLRLDLARVNETDAPNLRELSEQTSPGDAVFVNPQLLLDLLAGALTGSIESTDRADGSTGYRFNVSIDKANRALDLDEDERDDRAKLLKRIAVTGDVHRAEAVVRRDGSLARLKVVLTERPDQQAAIELHAELRLAQTPVDAAVLALPAAGETVRVASLGDIGATVAEHIGKAFLAQRQVPQP